MNQTLQRLSRFSDTETDEQVQKEAYMPPMPAGGMPAGGGMPGGMPADPSMAGMDPSMAGMPGGGADPAMAGMDPAMAGMDPAAGGMAMGADPSMGGMPPEEAMPPIMVSIDDLRALVQDIVEGGGKAGGGEGKADESGEAGGKDDRLGALEQNVAQIMQALNIQPQGGFGQEQPEEVLNEGFTGELKTAEDEDEGESTEELFRQDCERRNGETYRRLRKLRGAE